MIKHKCKDCGFELPSETSVKLCPQGKEGYHHFLRVEYEISEFQRELTSAIAEWHNAMDSEDIDVIRLGAGEKLTSLINRAVDIENLECEICKCEIEAMVCGDCV